MTKTVFWTIVSIIVIMIGSIGMVIQGLNTGNRLEFLSGAILIYTVVVNVYDALFGAEEEEVY